MSKSARASPGKMSAKQRGKQAEEPAQEAASVAKAKVKKPEKLKLRRLHVSGLPNITEQDAKDRFKSFGTVIGVDSLGKIDGNGNPLNYAFVDINITKSKLQQCMNLLSGSVWKGSTLRIAEAKPKVMDKLARERQIAATSGKAGESEQKKVKKSKKQAALESEENALVTTENVKDREGWKLDPATATPIFPIIARPDHPLPPLPEVATVNKKAKADKKKRKAEDVVTSGKQKRKASGTEQAAVAEDPPNRARRVKIDTTKWHPKHLREEDLAKLPDVSMVNEKPVRHTQSQAIETAEEESDSTSSGSASEEEGNDKDQRSLSEAETPTNDDDGQHERQKHLDLLANMLGVVPERVEASNAEQHVQSRSASPNDEEYQSGREETNGGHVAVTINGQMAGVVAPNPTRNKEEGSGSESDSHVDSDASKSSPVSDSDSGEKASWAIPAGLVEQAPEATDQEDTDGVSSEEDERSAGVNAVQMQSLTDMFKPQETSGRGFFVFDGPSADSAGTGGFSLGTFLGDLELDREEPDALQEEASAPIALRKSLQAVAPSRASIPATQAGYDPQEPLFFPFPLDEDFASPRGLLYGLSEQEKEALLSRSWTGSSQMKRFKRTQNIEEITAQHEIARRSLNEKVRKRHREAVKRSKRAGGRTDRGYGQDDL